MTDTGTLADRLSRTHRYTSNGRQAAVFLTREELEVAINALRHADSGDGDDEPLNEDDLAMIDQAWEIHKAALPVAVVINDNQPGKTAIIEITVDPPTLGVGTKLYAEPKRIAALSPSPPETESGTGETTEADMRAFAASDAACYRYPGDTEIERACRAAYIRGAADSPPETERGQFAAGLTALIDAASPLPPPPVSDQAGGE